MITSFRWTWKSVEDIMMSSHELTRSLGLQMWICLLCSPRVPDVVSLILLTPNTLHDDSTQEPCHIRSYIKISTFANAEEHCLIWIIFLHFSLRTSDVWKAMAWVLWTIFALYKISMVAKCSLLSNLRVLLEISSKPQYSVFPSSPSCP